MGSLSSVFLTLSFLFISISASAAAHGSDCEDHLSVGLVSAEESRLDFTGVEVYRRNNDISPQQFGDLHFSKWMVLSENELVLSLLGLTGEGRLFHLIQFKKTSGKERRLIARLLSGKKVFTGFHLYRQSFLIAEDADGNVFFYSPSVWMKKPGAKILRIGAQIWAGSTVALVAALSYGWQIPTENLWSATAYVGALNAFHTGFAMLQMFEDQNTYPDGFNLVKNGGLDPEEFELYDLRGHFDPPQEEDLFPLIPAAAREEIR